MATFVSSVTPAATAQATFGGRAISKLTGAVTTKATAQATFGGHSTFNPGFPYHKLGVKVELLINTTWTDITHYVLVRDNIQISPFGRTDEASSLNSSNLTMTLDNRDGRFTPDNTSGAYYPYVQLNTQIRVSVSDVSHTGVAYSGYRFWGEVSEWPPSWSPKGNDTYSTITASGIYRRLSQATATIGSPYTRFNNLNVIANNTVAAYWPMEDGTGATSFVSMTPSTAANMVIVTGTPSLGSCGNFRGSDAIPALSQAELSGTITTSSSPADILFRFCIFPPTTGDPNAAGPIARLHLTGTLDHVDVVMSTGKNGPTSIQGYNSSGTQLFNGSTTVRMWGQPIVMQVGLTQNGGNIAWSLNMVEQLGTGYYSTVTGQIPGTVSDATSVIFNPGANFSGTAVGQAIVIYGNPSIGDIVPALGGYQNEDATTRFTRICAEQGIATETIGGLSGTPMGVQIDDTFTNVLQSIEDTDGGLLYETRDQFGLGYRTMASLQNQTSKLTLDYNSAQIWQPLSPVVDDALTRNDITLTNWDGYAVRIYLANGARSILNPPNGAGTGYQYSLNTTGMSHTQVNNRGIQMLNCGTFSGSRYPNVPVNLARVTTAPLFNQIPSMFIGDYLTLTTMPTFGGPATQKQLVWGWAENISIYTWTIVYNTIPEAPWESSYNPGTSATGQVPGTPASAGTSNTVTGSQIAEGTIIGQNLAAGAVSGGNIANGTITATNIATASITGTNIASGTITGYNIGSASITGPNIANATITGSQIANATITATNIANATITSSQISTSAGITGSQIASGTIQAGNIQSATITNVQIAGSTITGSNIGSSTITAGNIQNATITSVQIANGTITTTQISNSAAITGTQVASGTITAANIAANTITASQIAANTITGSQIAANTIAAGNIVANTITAAQIASATITGTQIAASVSLSSPVITGGTITGSSIVADGSSGEVLVYSSTPASGNLVASISANSGSDGFSNPYNAGSWTYDSSGNSIGLVPGGGNASYLAMQSGSGTPSSLSGYAQLFGTGTGGVNIKDSGDGQTYSVGQRTLVATGPTSIASSPGTTVWTTSVSVRTYRVHGVFYLTISGGGTQQVSLGIGIPSGGGQFITILSRATNLVATTNIGVNSLSGLGPGGSLNSGSTYSLLLDGVMSVTTAGTMNVTFAATNTGDISVATSSFVEFLPV